MTAMARNGMYSMALALVIGLAGSALGAKPAPPAPLTEHGKQLEQRYAAMLQQVKAELAAAIPTIDEAKKKAYMDARQAENDAEAAVNAVNANLGKIHSARGLVGHATGKWIGGADKGIADTQAKLAKATTDAERKALQEELAKWQKNRADGVAALKERQANLDALLKNEPQWQRELEAAQKALADAQATTIKAVAGLGVNQLLASEQLDGQLARFTVLREATPHGLAAFAQQGAAQEALVDKLLADDDLMLQMAVADGAKAGKYGQAMKIYTDIQKVSTRSHKGPLQKLALAVALEHAEPIGSRNPTGMDNGPSTIDPVKRYLHYEKAFLNNELDPGFAGHTVWDYRFVVDGNEPDETLAWGRTMLANYRPDHVYNSDYRWRYVGAVRTEIRYGSQDNKFDRPDLQFFQNILMNGGVCGRRAFFGRFVLRAYGVPTTARPQPGHAALAHWTPDGWVICLGGGWGAGTTRTRYTRDLDFLANTQARAAGSDYMQVKRAQWIGDVAGEKPVYGFHAGQPGFWYGVSLYTQRDIIERSKAVTLAAVGEELGEANESHVKYETEAATVTDADRKIDVAADGTITIPAVATSNPTTSTAKIIFMPSNLGGKQMHYSRNGGEQGFEYTFDAPAAGKYQLTAKVVTPSWQQHLLISANGKAPVDLALPHTVGLWQTTKPVTVELAKGKNVLAFTHKSDGQAKGFTVHHFTLTPAK